MKNYNVNKNVLQAARERIGLLFDNFETSNEFITDALDNNGKVLIHCMAGRSRSATIVSAYIIKTFGMDPENTVKSIKSKRKIVQPNNSFLEQLDKYYKKLYSEVI